MRLQRHRSQSLSIFFSALIALAFGCTDGGSGHNENAGGAAGSSGAGGTSGEGAAGGGAVGGMGLVPEAPGEFVSADAFPGQAVQDTAGGMGGTGGSGGAGGGAAGTGAAPGAGDPRTVVEGDIYRVLDAGTLLNLNSYRGLQIIDVSDPNAPAIIGRLGIIGTPLEMYVRGTTAFVLLNNWQGYYGSRDDIAVEQKQGGLLVAVDISDHQAPRELDRMFVDGNIRTSRVAQNDAVAALYIASSKEIAPTSQGGSWVTQTIVTSVDISGAQLIKKSELDLGGYVTDIQATPTELLVAGTDYTSGTAVYTVGVVDISDPNGLMLLGDTVHVRGYVQDQFNMDLYNGVLRVVSQNWSSGGNGVETFDAHDLGNITPLHACEFGAGQQLYATLFLGNKAFFVTYFRTDPFHAFSIGDDGVCAERNEFIVSGWNDFFRPVAGGTRLVGVGSNDADTIPRPAVSLYDITNLDNANPLLARAEVESVASEWSEAQSDHRAFSVIENAVSVLATDGTEETGLVLLPYQGYQWEGSPDGSVRRTGVALFTFSGSTVTQRGTLLHDSAVRRSFTTDPDTIANLSETRLSLYDHSDPTAPEALGSVELAPDYMRVLRFGEHVARVKRTSPGYDGGSTGSQNLHDMVELVPASADLNTAAPIAAFEIPAGARLLKAGELLVTIVQPYEYTNSGDTIFTTQVAVHDLSDPTAPRAAGTAQTTDIEPTYFGYGYGYGYAGYYGGGFVGCGMGMSWFDGSQADGVFALGDKIVFVDARGETAPLGTQRTCELYPGNYCDLGDCQDLLQGYITCSSINGGAEVCQNYLSRCDFNDGEATCDPIGLEEARSLLADSCWEHEVQRVWSRYAFKALDLGDPDAPVFGPRVDMPRTEEGVSVLPDGDSLYYTYRVPVTVDGDERPHVSYYFKHVTFDDVQAPAVATRVNVPGELIAVSGSRLYTKDLRWGESSADTYLHELSIAGGQASIASSRSFIDRDVTKVVVEGDRLYAVHSDASHEYDYYGGYEATPVKLALLGGDGLTLDAELDIDDWATLEAVHDNRALFTVSGGLLMMNVESAAAPYAQAFFYSNGWPEQILFQDGEVLISAGLYGIHRFDADDTNLLTED